MCLKTDRVEQAQVDWGSVVCLDENGHMRRLKDANLHWSAIPPARGATHNIPHPQNVQREDGDFADFEEWYQLVRYANGPGAPRTLEEASELRYKDVLEAARVFNRLQGNTESG